MRKPASQGSKPAGKSVYLNVSDRRLQVLLTQKAKIGTGFSFILSGQFLHLRGCQRSATSPRHAPALKQPSFCLFASAFVPALSRLPEKPSTVLLIAMVPRNSPLHANGDTYKISRHAAGNFRMLAKPTDYQSDEKACKPGKQACRQERLPERK